jgi:hypothetical protein
MHVVLLLGSSTAGKSSLCKELVAQHKWDSGSIDEACDKIRVEQRPVMLDALRKLNLPSQLQSHMMEEEVQTLAATGLVTISKGDHQLSHQFQSPDLEGLEEKLKKADFKESEIPELARTLRLVTKTGMDVYHGFPDPTQRLYDDTFTKSNSGKSIVLDVVPGRDVEKDLAFFEKCAQQYREQHPGETLTTSVVFAYCPPQKLSERIQERNRKAETDNPRDKRVGLFPFDQLGALVTAEKKFDNSSENKFSRTELFYLINKHGSTDTSDEPKLIKRKQKRGATRKQDDTIKVWGPLLIENPVDPEALHQSADEKSQTITIKGNTVKLESHVDEVPEPSSADMPRVGSKKTIEEYGKLAARFGFFENQEQASLNIPVGLTFDAVVNTANGSPAALANEFIEKIEKSKTASQRVSRL